MEGETSQGADGRGGALIRTDLIQVRPSPLSRTQRWMGRRRKGETLRKCDERQSLAYKKRRERVRKQ